MKKRNMYIIAIVALVLILGIGYAAITGVTLTIGGQASALDSDLQVVYDGQTDVSDNTVVTLASATDGTTQASFRIEDLVKDQVAWAAFEIENRESDVTASIQVPTITNSNTTYFTAVAEYSTDGTTWNTWAVHTLAPNATEWVRVKVTLIATPVTSQQSSADITVSYDANPVSS